MCVEYLNGALRRNIIREITGIEITFEAANRKDKLGRFHFGLHIGSSNRPHVYL